MFALIELMTAAMFIALAVVFYINRDAIAGDLTIPIIFAVIGGCALAAAPVLFKLAKKHDENPNLEGL